MFIKNRYYLDALAGAAFTTVGLPGRSGEQMVGMKASSALRISGALALWGDPKGGERWLREAVHAFEIAIPHAGLGMRLEAFGARLHLSAQVSSMGRHAEAAILSEKSLHSCNRDLGADEIQKFKI